MRQLISSASLLILLLITLFTADTLASFEASTRSATHEAVVKRALKSANGFNINWHINGKRASLASHIVAKSYIAKSGAIKQSHLTTCGNACDVTSGCKFSQVIQLSKDSSGTVMCALHSAVIPSSKVTIKSGPSSSSTVITSYGIQRNVPKNKTTSKKTTSSKKATSTKKSSKKTTSKKSSKTTSKKKSKSTSTHHVTTTKKSTGKSAKTTTPTTKKTSTTKRTTSTTRTSTSATATATATANVTAPYFPPSPPGAYFVQFNSCPGLAATVPAFVNNQYNYSTSTSAYIVQHGSARNFNDYFTAVYNVIGNDSLIFAPNNYMTSDPQWPTTWYQPRLNLAWGSTWTSGGDAVGPYRGQTNALNGGKCSTLDTFDAALQMLDDRSRFPNLLKVYIVSHSGGANLVSKYSQFYNGNHNYAIRFIIANPANQAYFTDSRPYNLTLAAQNANNNGSSGTNPSDTPPWDQNNTTTTSILTPITSLTDTTTSSSSSTLSSSSTTSSSVSSTTTTSSTTSSSVSSTTTTSTTGTDSTSTRTSSTTFPVITETITTAATDSSGNTVATTITSTITESLSTITTATGTTTTTTTTPSSSPTSRRKRDNPDEASCPDYNTYPYQLDSSTMNRYVSSRFDSIQGVFNRWVQRDVVLLVGDYDTDARFPGGGQDCTNQAQGGPNRRDRAYGWWAYQNILAGTGTDVSNYFGYQELIATGAQQIYNGVFAHQICVVDGVGHDQNGMFASQCGVAAMTQAITGTGAGPQSP